MLWFSKFKQCNSAEIHAAVKAGCEASDRACVGAYYVFNGETLVISFVQSATRKDQEYIDAAIRTTRNMLPVEYKGAEFWDNSKFSEECPEKVKKATGYVSMFTPELNKI